MTTMKTRFPSLLVLLATFSTSIFQQPALLAQDTELTYQGRVTDSGTNFKGTGLTTFASRTSASGQGASPMAAGAKTL